jgi:hypothetical protein
MRKLLVTAAATTAAMLALSGTAAAVTQIPLTPYSQCPAVGAAPSCSVLLVPEADATVSVYTDPTVGPYDGGDDTLVGIWNANYGKPIDAVTVTGPGSGLALLDGDGLCTYGIQGCPFGPTGYEGPGTTITTQPSAYPDSAEISFNPPLAAGASAYFSLEGLLKNAVLSARQGSLTPPIIFSQVKPAPGSTDAQQGDALGFISLKGLLSGLQYWGRPVQSNISGVEQALARVGIDPIEVRTMLCPSGADPIEPKSIEIGLEGKNVTSLAQIVPFAHGSQLCWLVEFKKYWLQAHVNVIVSAKTTQSPLVSERWDFSVSTSWLYPTGSGWLQGLAEDAVKHGLSTVVGLVEALLVPDKAYSN